MAQPQTGGAIRWGAAALTWRFIIKRYSAGHRFERGPGQCGDLYRFFSAVCGHLRPSHSRES